MRIEGRKRIMQELNGCLTKLSEQKSEREDKKDVRGQ